MDEDQSNAKQLRQGRWSKEERTRFRTAYATYQGDWKAITEAVGTRSVVQVRSHAQKVLPKLMKAAENNLNTNEKPEETQQGTQNRPQRRTYQHFLYSSWLYHSTVANFCLATMKNLPQKLELEKKEKRSRDSLRAQEN